MQGKFKDYCAHSIFANTRIMKSIIIRFLLQNAHKFVWLSLLPDPCGSSVLLRCRRVTILLPYVHWTIQSWEKVFANLAKQHPGRARQKSEARAGRNFSQPRTKTFSRLCTLLEICVNEISHPWVSYSRLFNLDSSSHAWISDLSPSPDALLNHLSNKRSKGGYHVPGQRYVGSSYVGSRVVAPYDYSGGKTRVRILRKNGAKLCLHNFWWKRDCITFPYCIK